jgi:hypothetical protein
MSPSESQAESSDVDGQLVSLVHRFREVLALRPEVLKCLAVQGIQVEGWLKGEILAFLTEEQRVGRLVDFSREVLVGHGRRKADLTVDLRLSGKQCRIWIELKHYLIGWQKGILYNAYAYFNDPTNGIRPDIDKLLAIQSPHRYVLILMTANPGIPDWRTAIARFDQKFQLQLRALTDPADFPPEFFLGLIAVVPSAVRADEVTWVLPTN